MNTILYTGIMCLIWAIALFNGTGLGNAYHTTEYACYFLYAMAVLPVLFAKKRYFRQDAFLTFSGMAVIFIASSYLHDHGFVSLSYLASFMLVVVTARFPVREKAFRLTGIVFAALGATILAIYDFGSVLSGWNSNSIAMIGLFSYLIFAASLFTERSNWNRLMLIAVTIMYCRFIWPTNSRSCMISIIAMLLLILFGRKIAGLLCYRSWVRLCLFMPLLIAAFVSLYSKYGNIAELNAWSMEQFNKPLFNGRDTIWIEGFQILFDNILFGTGQLQSGVWHNSAISCLTAYGVLGYGFWIASFAYILRKGQAYVSDSIVSGCMTMFLLINIQQSFELGMFAPNPNLLIYLPLGILLGRIKYLKGN